jgi:hypothetical protein
MCFRIGSDKKPWTNTKVYKVVTVKRLRSGRIAFISPQASSSKIIEYKEGVRHHINPYAGTRDLGYTPCSLAGIYVTRTLAAARRYQKAKHFTHFHGAAIIELEVDPKDFLHQSDGIEPNYLETATYRAVRPTGKVYKVTRGEYVA